MALALEERSNDELAMVVASRTHALKAIARGFGLAAKTAHIGVPLAVVYGLISATVATVAMDLATALLAADPSTIDMVKTGGLGIAGFCGLYALLQFLKAETASRASWIPALFFVPALLVGLSGLALSLGGPGNQMGPVVLQLTMAAADLVFGAFGGAVVCIAWFLSARAVAEGRPISTSEIVHAIQTRTFDVAPVHAARDQAVTIGMQLLLPGIFYMLQLAFADMVVVLDPARHALRRSGHLSLGMRGRLFRVFFAWFAVTFTFTFGVICVDLGVRSVTDAVNAISKIMFDPSVTRGVALYVVEVGAALGWWVLQLSLLVLYLEREEQAKAMTLLRQRSQVRPT